MEKTRKTRNLQKSWNKKRPQDAESFAQFRRELRDFLRELGAEKAPKAHAGEETSAVSLHSWKSWKLLCSLLCSRSLLEAIWVKSFQWTGSPKARQREAQPGLLLPLLVEDFCDLLCSEIIVHTDFVQFRRFRARKGKVRLYWNSAAIYFILFQHATCKLWSHSKGTWLSCFGGNSWRCHPALQRGLAPFGRSFARPVFPSKGASWQECSALFEET